MTTLNTLSAASLVALYNGAVIDYAPEGFAEVKKFASKAKGVEALEALCAAGNLAVEFDGETATIVDTMADDAADDAADATDATTVGDAKGKVRAWGFALSSDAWLKANPRGGEARELYRKERRKAARMARKAQRDAKEAARSAE